jgi:hypothetical protein
MSKEKLLAEIERVKKSTFLPQAVKDKKIEKLRKELMIEEFGEEFMESKDKGDLKHYSTSKKSNSTSFGKHNDWYNSLDIELKGEVMEGAPERYWSDLSPKEKKDIYNKFNSKTEHSPKTIKTFKGKKVSELEEKECDELIDAVRKRREKQAKSEKKSKSKPVIEKVAKNVVQAAKQVINNIPAADIKDDAKGEINKMEKLEALTRKYLSDMRSILGEDYDKETIDGEMKDLHKIIVDLKKKYA